MLVCAVVGPWLPTTSTEAKQRLASGLKQEGEEEAIEEAPELVTYPEVRARGARNTPSYALRT